MKILYLLTFMITLSGVLTQDSGWRVNYPDNLICAVRGFSVSIPCSYYYPTSNPNIQVTQRLWCSMNSNTGKCTAPPYVYNSSSNTKSDFEYVGDDKSNCTLLIHNVQFNYSGEYRFRFITDATNGRWTGEPGVTLQTADLKVSLIRLSGNGTLKQGDSLNLTCDVNCTHSSSQFVWSKNNEQLNTSGPVLHFPALTVRDSGNYTCTWKTKETSGSKTIILQVEGDFAQWKIWIIVLVIVVVIAIVAAVVFYWRERGKAQDQNYGKTTEKAWVEENTHYIQIKPELNYSPRLGEETLHKEEVTYASVRIKAKEQKQGCVHTEQQKEDDSVIYSSVIKSDHNLKKLLS
ncbi:HEPACAM family member 2-like [Clarias gariepinus]